MRLLPLRLALALLLLALSASPSEAQYWALKDKAGPHECPPVTERQAYECVGAKANCWSPGVRDTDCPAHGLCCFDGCVATCLDSTPVAPPYKPTPPVPVKKPYHPPPPPPPLPPPKPHYPEPEPYPYPEPKYPEPKYPEPKYPEPKYPEPKYPEPESPPRQYPPEHHEPHVHHPEPEPHPHKEHPQQHHPLKKYPAHKIPVLPPKPKPHKPNSRHHFPKRTPHIVSPYRTATGCPHTPVRSVYECAGRTSHRCWSPGHADTDCPGNGLCCFDGCINVCVGTGYRTTPRPPLPPVDPCNPSPCGRGTTCTVNRDGNPVCQCQPGLIPKPDTIAGCDVECTVDPDCPYGHVCLQHACVPRPDPCNPSPCGQGTTCTESRDGNPICNCLPGLIPKPDTISGCGPECYTDPDCAAIGYDLVCQNQKCVPRPDPCNPTPCGPRTTCIASRDGNPVCRCQSGFVPKPDTITGCDYECRTDYDCHQEYGRDHVCEAHQCVPRPDPCHPSPCGPGTTCRMGPYDNAICECLPNLVPKPDTVTGCGPECTTDYECGQGFICQNQRCVERPDPCDPSPCGPGAFCTIHNGNAICKYV